MYLLTRPLPKLADSTAAFRAAGLSVCGIATTDIIANNQGLDALATRLTPASLPDVIIVTSVFAAQPFSALLARSPALHETLRQRTVIAVGSTTARLLQPWFDNLLIPQPQTSEGILTLPVLNSANRQHIVIIKGEGGRTALFDTLTARGDSVDTFDVYRRQSLTQPVLDGEYASDAVSGVIATSEQLALDLAGAPDYRTLMSRPWLTISERVASRIRDVGVEAVFVCDSASDSALIAWIKTNWE
ncbi:uroporphyrinogen-III synthase [Alteromonas sp. CYL-A6]|uniref:uroporphyrinogen-III synthase n=1 Tax=Alteromonas nitratireducens TaxID=3390813 RepID=UPI0034B0AC19